MKAGTKDLIRELKEIQTSFLSLARNITGPEPNEASWTAFKRSETCRKAAEELMRYIPQKIEREGSGYNWWDVCPECHGMIDSRDFFCRHCGQAVEE